MSCIQLDGSYTRSRMGGESVAYQGRKSGKTSNIIFLCDNQGQMIAMGTPKSGNHHDLYEINEIMQEIIATLLSLYKQTLRPFCIAQQKIR